MDATDLDFLTMSMLEEGAEDVGEGYFDEDYYDDEGVRSTVVPVQKEYQSFKDFVFSHKTQGEVFTHTGVGAYTGKFNIPESVYPLFLDLFCDEVFQKGRNVNLIERHANVGPIVVDIDFRYQKNVQVRSYTPLFIDSVVKIYNEVILSIFDMSDEEIPEAVQAFIFERPSPYMNKDKGKNNYKDGIHIMYPFLVTEPLIQYYIRDLVLKHPDLEPLLTNLPLEPSQATSQIIDRSVIWSNGWYMYGACKPGLAPYRLTRIIDNQGRTLPKDEYEENRLTSLLSIRNKTDCTPVKPDLEQTISNYREKVQKRNPKQDIPNGAETKFGDIPQSNNLGVHDEELKTVIELVHMLSDERAENYEDWMKVGWALHNISPESNELLVLWDEFSKRSHKYDEGACAKAWASMKKSGLTLGSLHYWASRDNPEQYKKLRAQDLRYWLENALTGTNVDVAKVLYRMCRYRFVCSSIKYKTLYEFRTHRWHITDDGIGLRSKIPNELVEEYQKLREHYTEKIQSERRSLHSMNFQANAFLDDSEYMGMVSSHKMSGPTIEPEMLKAMSERITRYSEQIGLIDTLIPKLKTTNFIENVVKESRGLFYREGFASQLDTNPYLLGFDNGVLELDTMIFREGRPEDNVSISTNYDYTEEWDPNSPEMESLKLFLQQVQPNDDQRDYLLTFLGSCLEGVNADESFNIWTGSGGNGKSKINELFLNTIGGYSCKLPITLLTGKRAASNAANPELMDTKGRRYCYMEETNDVDQLQVGLLKELTGGDKIKARGLYQDFVEFKPQFKMTMLCNELPKVPAFDGGTWRRLRVLEFQSRFVENPKEPNEFLVDTRLAEKMMSWRNAFMGLLIQYYQKYRKCGLVIPTAVHRFTKEYQSGMDQYQEFIETTIVKTNSMRDTISFPDLHAKFHDWYSQNVNEMKIPGKRDLQNYFKKRYGKSVLSTSILKGFKWKVVEEEETDNK